MFIRHLVSLWDRLLKSMLETWGTNTDLRGKKGQSCDLRELHMGSQRRAVRGDWSGREGRQERGCVAY